MGQAEQQAQREAIFERAKYGEISGDEADDEAERLGLGSLSSTPTVDSFRPENEPHWSLAMAMAWIAYRDIAQVRRWSDAYRAASTMWVYKQWRVGFDGPTYQGWMLEPLPTASTTLLAIAMIASEQDDPERLVLSARQTREAVWIALRDGMFAASGIDMLSGHRVEIPQLEWHELQLTQNQAERDELHHKKAPGGYEDILLPAEALRGFWPRLPPPAPTLPALVAPTGDGYMPLSCAAQWIATHGGSLTFDPSDEANWKPAYDELLGAMASERVRVVGLRAGIREPVPSYTFAGCQVEYPFSTTLKLMLGSAAYLRCTPYLDELHWREGFDDSLTLRNKDLWTQIMVERSDVRKRWPFGIEPMKSGTPGRPTSKHLYVAEMERRALAGVLAGSLADEAAQLLAWLSAAHPHSPAPTKKSLADAIRDRFRTLSAGRK